MSLRLTQKEVEDIFTAQNCVLIDTYKNAHTKVKYLCSCGNEDWKTLSHFRRGQRCKECKKRKRSLLQTLPYEKVKEYIESEKYVLISTRYESAKSKMHLKCPNGHDYFVNLSNFKSGKRCPECQGINSYTIEYAINYFDEHNCTLLEESYTNANLPMKYICECGNKSEISFKCFLQGQRCRKCSYIKTRNKQKKNFDDIVEYFEKYECKLLTESYDYENKYSPLKFICRCGNEHISNWSSVKHSNRPSCNDCRFESIAEKHRKSDIDEIRIEFEKRGFTLTSTDYKNGKVPLEFICNNGHNAKTHYLLFKQGAGCKQCYVEFTRGENHFLWNHERTEKERKIRRQFDGYRQWRQSVYERDNYICQCCGNTSVKLNAHHLDSYSNHIDKRIDVDNGISLCVDCHGNFHSIYGNKDNLKEQFLEYMEGISWAVSYSLK
jgi:hypothetical protein